MADLLAKKIATARFEKRYERPDGSIVWVGMNIRSLIGVDGAVVGFLTQGLDITKRKSIEAGLTQQALLFDAISDWVFVSDCAGRLTDCNPAAERLTGLAHAELLIDALAVGPAEHTYEHTGVEGR
jgi:PAS domain-containing protein